MIGGVVVGFGMPNVKRALIAWGMGVLVACAAPAVGSDEPVQSIRLNQIGFAVDGVKRAVILSDSKSPLEWTLVNARGLVAAEGETTVFGLNKASGETVHLIDFSALRRAGDAYKLRVGARESRSFPVSAQVYTTLKYDALAYFYHNRAGVQIEAEFAGGEKWARPAGHEGEVLSCFEGSDSRGAVWPGCDYELDITGGWYDAGDHGKYVVNGGISVWTLLNYYERAQYNEGASLEGFEDGAVAIPEAGNDVNDLLDEARWQVEFMLSMQIPEGARTHVPAFGDGLRPEADPGSNLEEIDAGGLVHHKAHGPNWTNFPSAPHTDEQERALYYPSTAATLNLAAVGAQCARVWKSVDRAFADQCLEAAERAFAAAERYPNLRFRGGFEGGGAYEDRDVSDEFYWAAAELFVTTGKEEYGKPMRRSRHFLSAPRGGPEAENDLGSRHMMTAGTLSLALVPSSFSDKDRARARKKIVSAADIYLKQREDEGYAFPYTISGYRWGSNGDIANRGLVLGAAYDFTGEKKYRDGVTDIMDYFLGRNPLDQSYVSGYGARPMKNPHHRFWGHHANKRFPPPPPGALSGGPNNTTMSDPVAQRLRGKCRPQLCWVDDSHAYALNEVAVNWNAPFFWIAAFLDDVSVREPQ